MTRPQNQNQPHQQPQHAHHQLHVQQPSTDTVEDALQAMDMQEDCPMDTMEEQSIDGEAKKVIVVKTSGLTTYQTLHERHPNISKSQMKEFREAFRLFDKDGDGSITRDELGRFMRSLGQFARAEELQQMLQEVDADGDGNVSFEEFVDIAWSAGAGAGGGYCEDDGKLTREEQEERELRDAFRVFDKHNRGFITASDLRAVLQCLGEDLLEDEIEDMIKEVDVDGDGRIDFYEFVNALGEHEEEDSEGEDEDDLPY